MYYATFLGRFMKPLAAFDWSEVDLVLTGNFRQMTGS
jgi:hypothetical protein